MCSYSLLVHLLHRFLGNDPCLSEWSSMEEIEAVARLEFPISGKGGTTPCGKSSLKLLDDDAKLADLSLVMKVLIECLLLFAAAQL